VDRKEMLKIIGAVLNKLETQPRPACLWTDCGWGDWDPACNNDAAIRYSGPCSDCPTDGPHTFYGVPCTDQPVLRYMGPCRDNPVVRYAVLE